MGNPFSRDMKPCAEITEKSLRTALEVIDFLKNYSEEEGVFRYGGDPVVKQKLLGTMSRGDLDLLKNMLNESTVVEAASALQSFLSCLDTPVLPPRVQQLLIADNPGVPAGRVAADALGLLRQDLEGLHLRLALSLLELFRAVSLGTSRTELTSVNLPITLLPTFFNVQKPWSIRWKQVASNFNELIMLMPPPSRHTASLPSPSLLNVRLSHQIF